MTVYLDYCASAPIDSRVLDVMINIYRENYGNADSRTHIFGAKAKEIVEKARKSIAAILDIDSNELIFTSGATESNNIAILGLIDYAIETGKKHIITTAIEHKAVLGPIQFLESKGFDVDYVYPDFSGRIDPEDLLSRIRPDTLFVSVMHVNNETGIIQPVEEIGSELDKKDILFHIDAAQSFGKLNAIIRKTKYNILSLSGHKIKGPQGIGALVLRRKKYKRPPVKPLFHGGRQEYGFRPGTTAVPLVAGLSYAAELCEKEHANWLKGCIEQKEKMLNSLKDVAYKINGDQRYCLPSIINISFDGIDAEAVFSALKEEYAFSNGSACTSGSYEPSHVLKAMGFDDKRINSSLRISWDYESEVDWSKLVSYIKSVV